MQDAGVKDIRSVLTSLCTRVTRPTLIIVGRSYLSASAVRENVTRRPTELKVPEQGLRNHAPHTQPGTTLYSSYLGTNPIVDVSGIHRRL